MLLLLRTQGLIYLITQHDKTHYRKTELAGIGVYFGWVFAVALAMPTWAQVTTSPDLATSPHLATSRDLATSREVALSPALALSP